MLVYLITNTVNGKRYVGRTVVKLETRWRSHQRYGSTGSHLPFHRAIQKYGADSFSVEILCHVDTVKEFSDAERFYIALLGTCNPGGYNICAGGSGSLGFHHSETTRAKLRNFRLGRKLPEGQHGPHWGKKLSEETKRKISASGMGRKKSEETRRKIGDAHRGKIMPREAVERIAAQLRGRPSPNRGTHHTEETKARMSAIKLANPRTAENCRALAAARKGKPLSKSHLEKMRESSTGEKNGMYGRTHSPEARIKIREAMILRHVREREAKANG